MVNYQVVQRKKTFKTDSSISCQKEKFLSALQNSITAQGWNPTGVARELGAEPSWLTRILKGERGMDIYDFIRIANIIGVAPGDLISGNVPAAKIKEEAAAVAQRLYEAIPDDVYEELKALKKKKGKKK